jgi:hypothetical protein
VRGFRDGTAAVLMIAALGCVAGVAGCASGAGPDGPTDRACKELAAASHAMSSLPTGDLSAVTDSQITSARTIADQLRTIATDATGGALADRMSALQQAADTWEAGWTTRDAAAVQRVRQQVADDVQACTDAGVIV